MAAARHSQKGRGVLSPANPRILAVSSVATVDKLLFLGIVCLPVSKLPLAATTHNPLLPSR